MFPKSFPSPCGAFVVRKKMQNNDLKKSLIKNTCYTLVEKIDTDT